MCGACKPPTRRSGKAESWSIPRKRGRSGVYASKSVPGAFDDGGNLRDALYPSGAKDDPRDADLLLDLLLKHRDKLRRLSPDTEATRRVQNLVEERRKLVDEKTEQTNRLTSHLKIYFPQILNW